VRRPPVVDVGEALVLGVRELPADLAERHHVDPGDLDQREALAVVPHQDEALTDPLDLLAVDVVLREQPGRRALVSVDDEVGEPLAEWARQAELERPQPVHTRPRHGPSRPLVSGLRNSGPKRGLPL
jgi:hypothetical protein